MIKFSVSDWIVVISALVVVTHFLFNSNIFDGFTTNKAKINLNNKYISGMVLSMFILGGLLGYMITIPPTPMWTNIIIAIFIIIQLILHSYYSKNVKMLKETILDSKRKYNSAKEKEKEYAIKASILLFISGYISIITIKPLLLTPSIYVINQTFFIYYCVAANFVITMMCAGCICNYGVLYGFEKYKMVFKPSAVIKVNNVKYEGTIAGYIIAEDNGNIVIKVEKDNQILFLKDDVFDVFVRA
jgi:hypothetical protein